MSVDENTSDGYHTFKELYDHRHALFKVILVLLPTRAWKSRLHHESDGDMYEGSFIAGIETDEGPIRYHLDNAHWDSLYTVKTRERAPKWDGQGSDVTVPRLEALVESISQSLLFEPELIDR
jgi:hypothetical protein